MTVCALVEGSTVPWHPDGERDERSSGFDVEGSTVPWRPDGEPNAVTEYPPESVSQYNLVLDEGTEIAWRPTRRAFPKYSSRNALVQFSNARELETLDVPSGFISANESVFRLTDALVPARVEAQLDRLCSAAHEEQFEAGMESRFSRGLQQLCAYDPNAVLQSLRARLVNGNSAPEILTEMLEWASRQEAAALRDVIVDLFSIGLNSTSPLVRDAAASGLAYLDGDAAISYLKQAIEREQVPELLKDLEDLVHSLET